MQFFSSFWLLPILFMFHDFEELVSVPSWITEHDAKIGRMTLFGAVTRSDVLSWGIWEEFTIFILIAMIAGWLSFPLLLVAAVLPYLAHLGLHILFVILKKSYVPGVITAVFEIPLVLVYLIANITKVDAGLLPWFVTIVSMFIVFAINIKFIHWWMNWLMHMKYFC